MTPEPAARAAEVAGPTGTTAEPVPSPALLGVLAGRRPTHTPAQFMHQTGWSLPEYRAPQAHTGVPILEVCLDPALAAEVTLQPVRHHGVDAAIFFSGITMPLRPAGIGVRIEEGVGPVLDAPMRSNREVSELVAHRFDGSPDTEGVGAIEEAVRRTVVESGSPQAVSVHEGLSERVRAGLEHSIGSTGWIPVLVFNGAPFTLAAYLVEGRPSRDHLAAYTPMRVDPDSWGRLMTWCARLTGEFITTQVRAGAAAARLFGPWADSLSSYAHHERVVPYLALALGVTRQAVSPITGKAAPLIHFGIRIARSLGLMRQTEASAVGVDEHIELGETTEALTEVDPQVGTYLIQGNLSPALLAASWPTLAEELDAVLAIGRAALGRVVNLGHGVPPVTDADILTRAVAWVHDPTDWESMALAGWGV